MIVTPIVSHCNSEYNGFNHRVKGLDEEDTGRITTHGGGPRIRPLDRRRMYGRGIKDGLNDNDRGNCRDRGKEK